MRRRPQVSVKYWPERLVPGTAVTVEVLLTSLAMTPVEGVELTLTCVEGPETAAPHEHFRQTHKVAGTTLPVGEHRIVAEFTIPSNAPPTYQGLVSILYRFEVSV